MFENEWPNVKREYYMVSDSPLDLNEHELFCMWCGHMLITLNLVANDIPQAVLFASQYVKGAPVFKDEIDVRAAYEGLNEKGLVKETPKEEVVLDDTDQYIEI